MIFKYSVPASKETYLVFIGKIRWLMLCREVRTLSLQGLSATLCAQRSFHTLGLIRHCLSGKVTVRSVVRSKDNKPSSSAGDTFLKSVAFGESAYEELNIV